MQRFSGITIVDWSRHGRRSRQGIPRVLVLVAALSMPGAAHADFSMTPGFIAGAALATSEPATVRVGAFSSIEQEQPNQPNAEWQRQYDAARGKMDRGRVWLLAGIGIIGAGITMMATDTAVFESCDGFVCTIDYRVPALVTTSGVSALVWGIIQRRDAGRTIRDLESQRRIQTPTQAAVPLGRNTAVGLGPRAASLLQSVNW